jgi:hypothetical protein
MTIEDLQKEIEALKARNVRVEADKAWETSEFRITTLSVLIYIIAAIFMYMIGVNNYLLNALVPAIGYFLSMQSLPFIKKWWVKKYRNQK